ncbi:MAG: CvpA family protein [Planctomycetota bacterium]|nr:CvpA family protein [Planctomycetota bacterium]
MTEATTSAFLAALPDLGGYFSLVKMVFLLAFLAPWWLALPWVVRDAKAQRASALGWGLGLLTAGVVGLIVWFFAPFYLAGLAAYVVFTGGVGAAYVVYRNGKVDEDARVLTLDHLKGLLTKDVGPKDLTKRDVHIKVYNSSGLAVPPPTAAADVPVYNMVQDLLYWILFNRASEVDLAPTGQETCVRFVIDGVVREMPTQTLGEGEAIIQYFKGIGGMDVAERRRPQTGKLSADMAGSPVDMELTTTGTTAGQRLRFRVLREAVQLDLTKLGMTQPVYDRVCALAEQSGLVIASGKHGSGLTSTLYSLLSHQDAYMKQIMTVEAQRLTDLENVTQNICAQESQRSGLLSAGLRRDPAVVMVDQCTDAETARLILQAAEEKQVLLGVNASEALVALAKWVGLVGEPAKALANLRGVLCQVLLRKLCLSCREAYRPNSDLLAKLNLPDAVDRFYRPPSGPLLDKKGRPVICPTCQGTGYLGRTGVFELLEVTDDLRKFIAAALPTSRKSSESPRKTRLEQELSMITALVATILILGITAYQITHGLYSALIMAVLSILAALAAMSLYEPICRAFLYEQMPSYAEAVALVSLFLLILLGLRELTDQFLPSNMVLGVWPDRIVGGVFGLITGLVITGVLALGFQLLPFGRSAAGYCPCDESLVRSEKLWLFYPDDFVLGLAKRLSVGGLGAGKPFAAAHYDLIQETYATRNRLITGVLDSDKKPVRTLVGQLHGRDGDFRVLSMHNLSQPGDLSRMPLIEKALLGIQDAVGRLLPNEVAGSVIVAVRVAVRDGAVDDDAFWRLPATHFRLVDPEGKPHYPIGFLFVLPPNEISPMHEFDLKDTKMTGWNMATTPSKVPPEGLDTGGRPRIADLVVQRSRNDGINGDLFVDWVFCLPAKLLEDSSAAKFHMVFRGRLQAPFDSKDVAKGLPTADKALRHAFLEPRKAAPAH